jgi:hypothetical protein
MVWFAAALIAGAFAATGPIGPVPSHATRPVVARAPYELLTAPDRHVRATDERTKELLAQGFRRSKTLVALVSALESTDVIVHVEISQKLSWSIAGRLLFVTALENGPRYLRVQIAEGGTKSEQIAAIAHELQHALEVSQAPDVRCKQTFNDLYERIGLRSLPHAYDTLAAQTTGQRVLLEIGRQ